MCGFVVGGWATFSLLHVMTYKAKTFLSKIGACVYCYDNDFQMSGNYDVFVGSISLSCHLPDVFQTCLINECKAN